VRYLWILACALLVGAFHQPAYAADAVEFGPPPAWVQPIRIPPGKSSDDDASVRALLEDSQVYFGPDGESYYFQSAYKILTADGLDDMGLVSQSWDPLLDTLVIHAVEIIRDGKVIDALHEGEPFSTIRREQNLNYAMLDGRLTATKQLEDLRIGDIVRVAMTITSKDPSLADNAEFWDTIDHEGVIARLRYRYVWPKGRDLRWRTTEGFNKVVESQTDLGTELVADGYDVRMPLVPRDAPDRFNTLGEIEITSFKSWRELSALFAPYYVQAATLKADSPLHAEAAKIREAHADKIGQASAALALVEQRVRYLALTMGQAGYQPAQADLTWSRRFGDCKGKTTLLIALLKELGIDAEPALVRTHDNDALDHRFPRAGLFDHVIVRADIDGHTYWMDPTRSGDKSIERLSVPPYLWALPLRAGGGEMEPLVMTRAAEPLSETTLELDETAGLDADNPAVRTEVYRGESAAAALHKLQTTSKADAERAVRERWAQDLPWFTIEDIKLGYELAEDGSLTHVIKGKAKSPWVQATGGKPRTVSLGDSVFTDSFDKREAGRTPSDAPYSLNFPYFNRSTVILKLPRHGVGFDVVGPDVDKTVAGMAVRRTSTLKDGVFRTVLDVETVASEIPYKEGIAAKDVFARLPTAKAVVIRAPVDFASTGKEVDSLLKERPKDAQALVLSAQHNLQIYHPTAASADADRALALDPKNADALRLKSVALADTGDVKGALAVFDEMLASPSDAPVAYLLRSAIYELYERYDEALADADKAIELVPNYAGAFSHRAEIYRAMGKEDLAVADIETAVKLDPEDASLRRLKIWYAMSKNAPFQPWRDQMIAYLDGLIAADKSNADLYAERGDLLEASRRYDLARKDFDKAISIAPTAPHYLQRAAFLADRQEDKAALADYDRAVRLEPTAARYQARALYHSSQRDFEHAREDIDAAMKLDASNPELTALLAYLEIKTGDAAAAFSRIESLSRQDPASFELMEMKAGIHAAGKAYDLALADLAALEARPGNTPAQARSVKVTRSGVLVDKGDYAAAIAILDELIAKEPGEAALLNERCWARATGKIDLARAKADCDAALALTSPTDAGSYLDSLGLVYLQLGRDADALQTYDRVLANNGHYSTSLYGRGLAKAHLGDKSGSQADMAAAMKLNPEVATDFLGFQLAAP
jgi:tetratricopeptide (TPR) repeat protein